MNAREKKFVKTVWSYYKRHGRHSLPWRKTKNPYRILVSEIMLQQTQVHRVIPKYREFLKRFPTVRSLAEAPLGDVLRAWQGLGYNRRAKMLHECARTILKTHRGAVPKTYGDLVSLRGIGPYTAGAILAFVYNTPVPMIETNIRSVYLHHFFKGQDAVPDAKIIRLIERTLNYKNPREWYYALMDYGAYVKKTFGNENVRSKHHTKQSSFKGSLREVRGAILRTLASHPASTRTLSQSLSFSEERIDTQLTKLLAEGLVARKGKMYMLPN